MRASWAGPGYEVGPRLGPRPAAASGPAAAPGTLWHGRERTTGEPVVLRRLPAGADPASVRRSAILLRTLPTAYLLRVRAVLAVEGRVVVVTDLAAGGSVARLVARRGRLEPGEVITVALALADALAALHGRRLVSGALTPERLLLSGAGLPMLMTGLAAGLAPNRARPVPGRPGDDAASSAADVSALAALCQQLLAGSPLEPRPAGAGTDVSAPVAELLAAVLAAPPDRRPSAAEFEADVRAVHEPAPIRLAAPAPGTAAGRQRGSCAAWLPPLSPRPGVPVGPPVAPGSDARCPADGGADRVPGPIVPSGPARHRPRRRPPLRALAGLALGVAIAATVGWASGRSGTDSPAAASVPPPPRSRQPVELAPGRLLTPDLASGPAAWQSLIVALDAARDRALSAGNADLLLRADAPASGQLAVDRGVIAELRRAGERARGVRHGVRSVMVARWTAPLVWLVVVDRLAAYDLIDQAGRLVEHRPARPAEAFDVTVARTSEGYRLQRVTPR